MCECVCGYEGLWLGTSAKHLKDQQNQNPVKPKQYSVISNYAYTVMSVYVSIGLQVITSLYYGKSKGE